MSTFDKFGTLHFSITDDMDSTTLDKTKHDIMKAMHKVRMDDIKAVSVNYPIGISFDRVMLSLPATYKLDSFHDMQEKLIRFVYDPAGRIPRGGNADLGGTALILDETGTNVVIVKNAMNGRLQLPGGRSDGTESPAETAAREAFEKAGITLDPKQGKIVTIQRFPTNQFVQGVNIVVRWTISKDQVPRPDGKETSEALWMPISTCTDVLPHITEYMVRANGWSVTQEKSWYQIFGGSM